MKMLLPLILGVFGFLLLVSIKAIQSVWKMESIISVITRKDEEIINQVIDVVEDAPKQADLEPTPAPPAPPADSPKLLKATIVPHTIQGCPPCEYDKRTMYPLFKKAGWSFGPGVDETTVAPPGARYPWYEIFDTDGSRTVHVGSLSTYKKK